MSNKKDNKILGSRGEDYACMFLVKHGFSILNRNYRNKIGEIDIIAEKTGKIHFIEVKSVSRETFNSGYYYHNPEQNINNRKISKIERVALEFISRNNFFNKDIQIDAITVEFLMGDCDDILPRIKYIPNINIR